MGNKIKNISGLKIKFNSDRVADIAGQVGRVSGNVATERDRMASDVKYVVSSESWCGPAADAFVSDFEGNLKNIDTIVYMLNGYYQWLLNTCDNYDRKSQVLQRDAENVKLATSNAMYRILFGNKGLTDNQVLGLAMTSGANFQKNRKNAEQKHAKSVRDRAFTDFLKALAQSEALKKEKAAYRLKQDKEAARKQGYMKDTENYNNVNNSKTSGSSGNKQSAKASVSSKINQQLNLFAKQLKEAFASYSATGTRIELAANNLNQMQESLKVSADSYKVRIENLNTRVDSYSKDLEIYNQKIEEIKKGEKNYTQNELEKLDSEYKRLEQENKEIATENSNLEIERESLESKESYFNKKLEEFNKWIKMFDEDKKKLDKASNIYETATKKGIGIKSSVPLLKSSDISINFDTNNKA